MSTEASTSGATAPLVIERTRGWVSIDIRELWRRRDVLYILIWRDLKVRYKQTVLGFLWAFLQPFTKMIVFSVIFGRWGGWSPPGVPYPVFVFAGLLPWEFFAASLTRCSGSIVSQQQFITKVYFPRVILPLSAVGSALVDFAISFLILIGLILYYPAVQVTPSLLLVIPLVVLTVMIAFGAGALLAALNVAYRDVRHIVPFIVQLWMFLTPIIYPVSRIPSGLRWLMALNPMMGIVQAFRWAIYGHALQGTPLDWMSLATSFSMAAALTLFGLAYFRRTERVFADIV